MERVFGDKKFDYIVNLAGHTRAEPSLRVLKSIPAIAKELAKGAAASGCTKCVHFSSFHVYKSDKVRSEPDCSLTSQTPQTEDAKLKPWGPGIYHLDAEEVFKRQTDFPAIIARPALVFGPGDRNGLSTWYFLCFLF